jgi:pimeloyl-ACP methyl ester carboxylesterase
MTTTLILAALLLVAAIPVGVHLGFRAPRRRERGSPAAYGLRYEPVRIPTVRRRHLMGWWLPASGADCTLVLVHGWGGNAEMMLPLALPLHRAGYNLLLYAARNHGHSDSDTFSSLPRFAEDLGAAIAWLKRHRSEHCRRIVALGHSVGAGAALFEATRNGAIAAVVSIAAFAHPAEVTARMLRPLPLSHLLTPPVVRYVEWLIGHRFERIAPINSIRLVPCPVLLVHGQADGVVPIEDARRIAASAPPGRARLIEIPDAGHDSVEPIERHIETLLAFLDTHCSQARSPSSRTSRG